MAVSVRLSRQGAKKNPQYLIVAIDSNQKRDGAYLDKIGHYYPKAKEQKDKIKVNVDLMKSWLRCGAQLSQTVQQLWDSFLVVAEKK